MWWSSIVISEIYFQMIHQKKKKRGIDNNNTHLAKYQHYYYSCFQGFVIVAVILFWFWVLVLVLVCFLVWWRFYLYNNAAISFLMLPSLYVSALISLGQIAFPNVELLGESYVHSPSCRYYRYQIIAHVRKCSLLPRC